MFVPGLAGVRVVTRIVAFALPLLAWGAGALSGKRPSRGRPSRAVAWAAAAAVWLAASVFHPQTNSPISGAAEALIDLAILSPVFWRPRPWPSPGRSAG